MGLCNMDKQLRVVKADGATEAYLHTKVLGTINNALSAAGQPDMTLAEHLAQVVTFHLYQEASRRAISSGEILSIIKAVLSATGGEEAAAALTEHALERRLRRSRTEVIEVDVHEFADIGQLSYAQDRFARAPWNKTRIVRDLTTRFHLPRQVARTIASLAEERIFRMGMATIPRSLVKQIVLGETAAVLHAEQSLQAV